MRLGIFGGTFNPPHKGHLAMAECFLSECGADKLLLIPNALPPHKAAENLATGEERCQMLSLAFSHLPCKIDKRELQREGKSYTIDTLAELEKEYPDARMTLIVGGDSLMQFEKWVSFAEILKKVTLFVLPRPEQAMDESLLLQKKRLEEMYGARVILAKGSVPSVSSTKVRQAVKNGFPLAGMLPKGVADYIKEKGLYRDRRAEAVEEKKYGISLFAAAALAAERLSAKRAHHSFCVSEKAKELALRHGGDPELLAIAGCLHDLYREESADSLLKTSCKYGIVSHDILALAPPLWHSHLGARLLEKELGVCKEICDAVDSHTEGKEKMTKAAEILFVADAISADRNYHDVEDLRRLADNSLSAATAYIFDYMEETLGDSMRDCSKKAAAYYRNTAKKRLV